LPQTHKTEVQRKISPINPGNPRSKQDKIVDPQQIVKQQIIPPQSIDRFQLMNDQFDLDQFEDNYQNVEPNRIQQ
jgi:hypothetical protein